MHLWQDSPYKNEVMSRFSPTAPPSLGQQAVFAWTRAASAIPPCWDSQVYILHMNPFLLSTHVVVCYINILFLKIV